MVDNKHVASYKIGVIGLAGKWSTETLADEVEALTGFRCIIDLGQVSVDLAAGSVNFAGHDLCQFDALIVKKIGAQYSPNSLDRLALLEWIAQQGVRVYSDPSSMGQLVNRLSCTLKLQSAGIPMPATVLCEELDQAVEAIRGFGEAVLKPFYSTKAVGMVKVAADDSDLMDKVNHFKRNNAIMYIQQRVYIPGRDLGIMFLGGNYIGTYARVAAQDSWNTTTQDGGHYAPHEPRQTTIAIATRAQALFKLAFTTVDVVETDDDNETVVFEVSAFGGFKGAETALDMSIAKQYAAYVVEQLELAS